ncbi:MAG: VRR-NUC domain-containing protein [Pseudomonadota bacterium]|nr:VRR-NUC domain-containing protein [Pseudomonadota bacterium]
MPARFGTKISAPLRAGAQGRRGVGQRMAHPEDDLQITCANWLRAQHPKLLFHHSPNESDGSKAYSARLKAKGRRAGWPDFEVMGFGGVTLFVELKSRRGRHSPAQETVRDMLMARGHRIETVRDFETFRALVTDWIRETQQ